MSGESHHSTHPPLPPTTEDDRVSWLRLLRSRRVGPATFHRLIAEHGSAQAALAALPDVARAAGQDNYQVCPVGVVINEMKQARSHGARMVCIYDPAYPAALAEIDDAPPVLWVKGNIDLLHRPMIALVGARNASSLGLRMARMLAHDLGQAGYVVVSGMARGIDTAAHTAALDSGTIAVLGGGVDNLYPSENAKLGENIGATGLRLSEQPMGLQPQARHFPRRNRIISGLCRALVVVEAAHKSGSLITARAALDQGREVLAVPGHPFDGRSAGANMLIRDGARLVRGADDIIECLPPITTTGTQPQQMHLSSEPPQAEMQAQPRARIPAPPPEKRGWRDMARLHQAILDRLTTAPLAEDQLIRDVAAPAQSITPALTDLELDGKVIRQPGGLLSRTG